MGRPLSLLSGAVVALAVLVVSGIATAQTVTPADIFQLSETINAQLDAFHAADASKPEEDAEALAVSDRLPRHVFQKAREVLLKVQELRVLKGLPEQAIPTVEVREVQPADTRKLLDQIVIGLQELRPAFGNPPAPAPVPLVEGKTPTDAYRSLVRASLSLDGLGLPPATPNEVYRVALTIVSDLDKIRAARGVTTPVALPGMVPGKKPVDVYEAGYGLLGDLKNLVETKPDFAIPHGIVLPAKRTGVIKPAHAVEILNIVLGEISAIKAKVGATKPTELAPAQSGKSPSDTLRLLTQARAMVGTL